MSSEATKNLHRIQNNENDWDRIEPENLNFWQKIAKKTRGIATAANLITLAGTVAVMNGLAELASGNKASGIAQIATGRMADLADGYVADKTGTKGKVGRAFDPFVDWVQLGVALPVLVSNDMLPLIPAVAVAAPKIVDGAATIAATLRHKELNPTKEGKWSVAAIWGGLGALMLKGALDKHVPGFVDTTLEVAGWGGTIGGAVYHLPATAEYASIGFGNREFVAEQEAA